MMGIYINPPGMSKEDWLVAHGTSTIPPRHHRRTKDGQDELAVCLIHNFAFSAAAIAFSPRELEAFGSPLDARPKLWFWVPTSHLTLPVCGVNMADFAEPDEVIRLRRPINEER